jgi:hypothetical protein
MYACNENNYEIVYYFIKYKSPNLHIQNLKGECALSIACSKKYTQIIYILIKSNTFDFNNLEDKLYIPVYYPILKKMDKKENSREQKIGGSLPFFIEGEKWPVNNSGIQLTFLGQFIIQNSKNNNLYRIFFDTKNMDEQNISKIELSKKNISKQIIIKPNCKNTNQSFSVDSSLSSETLVKENTTTIYTPYKITSWNKSKELYHIEHIIQYFYRKYNIDINKDEKLKSLFEQQYENSSYTPLDGIKIGGTSLFCQYNNYYDNPLKFRNFIQISECNELPYSWGDSGIAHIYEDYENGDLWLDFDCY